MPQTRQYLDPAGNYVNETTNSKEYLAPGSDYVNETTTTTTTVQQTTKLTLLGVGT